VNDRPKLLWPARVQEKVLILYFNAAAYMLKAATVLKVFHPNLITFSYLTYGLHCVAKEVKAKFPQVNK
jgi:hypothetical protein